MRSAAEINAAAIGSIGRTVDGVFEVTSAAGSAAEADWFIWGGIEARIRHLTFNYRSNTRKSRAAVMGAIVDFRSRGRQSCRMMACMGQEEEQTKPKILLPEDLKKE